MKRFLMMMTLIAASLLIGLPAFAAQVSIGINFGPPPPPLVVRVLPATPGPEFLWVEGYWYPIGNHWGWHKGYWTRAPYAGARWYAPRYERSEYFEGYWEGDRGRIQHDHHWDHDRDRDFREKERGHGRGHDRHEKERGRDQDRQ